MRKTKQTFNTNNEIVEFLFKNNYFNNIVKPYKLSQYDKDDLIQIVCVYLLIMNTEKLIDIYERDKLLAYIQRMCYKQYTSTYSDFNLQIIKFDKITDEMSINDDYDDDDNKNEINNNEIW